MVVCEICHVPIKTEELHEVYACPNCTKHKHLVLSDYEQRLLISILFAIKNQYVKGLDGKASTAIDDILERLNR